jgi:VIT1/CCC1 family predicted Fe2+/Mn2+ transporter
VRGASSRSWRLHERRSVVIGTLAVLAIWLVGAAVTRYSLEQMAIYMPLAIVVLGLTAAVVVFWIGQLRNLRGRGRSGSRT